jgi:hypothetical protein
VLLAVLVAGCSSSGGAETSSRCQEAKATFDAVEAQVIEVQERREGAAQGQIPELERETQDKVRRGAQVVLAEPDCFSVKVVADAQEYLDATS